MMARTVWNIRIEKKKPVIPCPFGREYIYFGKCGKHSVMEDNLHDALVELKNKLHEEIKQHGR